MFWMHVCLCIACVPSAHGVQKRELDPWGMEQQLVVSHPVGSGDGTHGTLWNHYAISPTRRHSLYLKISLWWHHISLALYHCHQIILMFRVFLYLYSKNNMKVPLASSFPVTEQLRNYGKSAWSITRFSGTVLTSGPQGCVICAQLF